MKRKLILSVFFLNLFVITQAQELSFWPEEVRLFPKLDVEMFSIDKSHSKLRFSIGFLGMSDVEGSFDRFGGTVLYSDKDLTKTSISLLIDASTISTGSSTRDKDLNKEKFFDTENHRFITFKSKEVVRKGRNLIVVGDLTMKGVTKEMRIPFERTQGRFIDPFWSNLNIGFKGSINLNRSDFNIHGGRWGEKVLSDEVAIDFAIVAKQPNTYKWGSGDFSVKTTEIVDLVVEQGLEAARAPYLDLLKGQEKDGFAVILPVKRLIQKYHFKEALAFCEFIADKFPDHKGRVSREMGKIYLYLGEREKALEIYELLGNNPYDTESWEVLKALNR